MLQHPFEIKEECLGEDTLHLSVNGRVSSLTSGALQERLAQALQAGRAKIILNMCLVAYLSSAGIRVLLSIYKKAKALDIEFFVENPSENAKNVLGLTALDEMLLRE